MGQIKLFGILIIFVYLLCIYVTTFSGAQPFDDSEFTHLRRLGIHVHRKSRECHYRRHLSNLFCINTLLVFLFAEPTMVRYATEPENASKCKFYRDFSLPVCSHSRTFVNRVTYVGLLVSLYQLCGPARTDTLDCQEHNVKSTVTTWDNSSAEVKFLGYFERHFTFCTRQTQTSDFI